MVYLSCWFWNKRRVLINNGEAVTASISVGTAGGGGVWSVAGSSAGGFAGSGSGGAQCGGTGGRNVGAGKELTGEELGADYSIQGESEHLAKGLVQDLRWQEHDRCCNMYPLGRAGGVEVV